MAKEKIELTDAQKAEKKAKAQQEKATNFVRLASARMSNALTSISKVGGLANKASYSYTADQVTKMEKALNAEVATLIARFNAPETQAAKVGFDFAADEAAKSDEEVKTATE